MPPMKMLRSGDPKQVILDKIGMVEDTIPGFQLLGNRVLIAIYEREKTSKVTQGGIHLPDSVLKEDSIQGKAALVVALGPTAFVSDERVQFDDAEVLRVGDWVMAFVSQGIRCAVNGVPCRIIRDQDITMRIPDPDAVW
jgi:co-chaperonin GroES (HSP10)